MIGTKKRYVKWAEYNNAQNTLPLFLCTTFDYNLTGTVRSSIDPAPLTHYPDYIAVYIGCCFAEDGSVDGNPYGDIERLN